MSPAPTLAASRDHLAAAFDRRVDDLGLVERHLVVAGRPVTFRFAGDRLVDDLTDAFAHLPTHDGQDGLTVHCWVADPDEALPPLPREALPETPADNRVDPGEGGLRAHYDWEGRTLLVHDLDTARAWRCCPDPDEIPWWERAAPVRMSLAWHLDALGPSFLHGAAVARGDHAALLVGPGGSGKSTTSLACLDAGFSFLGDDYCAGDAAGERVLSVYGSAKVAPEGLAAVEAMLGEAARPPGTHGEKVVVWPNRARPEQMQASARIGAVLVPTVVTGAQSSLAPIGPGAALTALAPSTILQLPGLGPRSLRHMGAITGSVPCWALTLGHDPVGVVAAVDEALERSAPP